MATKGPSFQNLGNGAYRVGGARVNPNNGQYVVRESAGAAQRRGSTQASNSQRGGAVKKSGK